MMHFEDGGRDHESRGCRQPLEKAKKEMFRKSPEDGSPSSNLVIGPVKLSVHL